MTDRAGVLAAFGAAGVVSMILWGVAVALLANDGPAQVLRHGGNVIRDETATVAAVLLAVGASGALGAVRVADQFGRPPGPRAGALPADAVRGAGAGLFGFVIGSFLVPLAAAVIAVPTEGVGSIFFVPFVALAGIVFGSFTLLPLALLLGGLTGWLVGRARRGTRTAPVG